MIDPRLVAVIAGLLLAGAPPGAGQREPSLREVVGRVGTYVSAYGQQASLFVGTETYRQDATGADSVAQHRTLVSEFAIVRSDALRDAIQSRWVGFRDVVEVDGHPIVEHRDRLMQILTGAAGRFDEARRLSEESARFNVGDIARNFNVPTAALFFFQAGNLDRFKFKKRGVARVDDADAWEIEFHETYHPSLVRMPTGESLPSVGALWVNPADGTVLKTHLQMQGFSYVATARTLATVDVTYARVPDLGVWLPQTMSEEYSGSRGASWERITGTATYANYRRFETSVRIK
jgi:hypothetical protein